MNDKFNEIGAGLAVSGSIVYAFLTFMDRTGISGDIAASYGVAIKDLVLSVGVVLSIIASARFLHEWGIVGAGADPIGTGPRDKYDVLRKSLAAHEDTKDGYARRLKKFLARVDTFFGDAGKGQQRFFLLREPAALWTAPAFDRCLLLALFYPVAAIFLIWAVSGEVGPAEQALQLKTTDGPHRFAAITLAGIEILAFWRFRLAQGWRRLAWLAASAGAGAGAFFGDVAVAGVDAVVVFGAFAVAGVVAGVVAVAVAGAGVVAGAVAGVVAVASAGAVAGVVAAAVAGVVAIAGVVAFAGVVVVVAVVAGVVLVAGVVAGHVVVAVVIAIFVAGDVVVAGVVAGAVSAIHDISAKQGWQDKFLTLFVLIGFAACLAAAKYSALLPHWRDGGPLLLFLGLLTLVNAPFDWLSLGLTRLLLRRGIEQGGPWPYFYALIDALAASALIALLAVAMVGATDLFDHLAELGGGEGARVLPPMRIFLDDLRATPQKAEYWWVYATLFSTMLPSVINLFIAGFSFLRGLPMLRKFLLGLMREGEAMPATDRLGAALILTSQGAVAFVFAVAAQVFLTWVVVYHLMPRLGLGILDLAKKVAM